MRIVMFAENDPAGMGIAFCKAINAYSRHSCRLLIRSQRYNFGFERDLFLPWVERDQRFDEVRAVLAQADLFHFHILLDENANFGPIELRDYTGGKKIVHHHHGHPEFRADPLKWQKKYRDLGRPFLVSTPDLHQMAPDSTWMPNLAPVDDPDYTPRDFAGDDPRRPMLVLQTPTRLDLKNTAQLRALFERLERELAVKLELVENLPHREALRRRRAADVVFDHMQGYYGVSSLEGLSMGLPVIAGLSAHTTSMIGEFTGLSAEDLPWVRASDDASLEAVIRDLAANPSKRRDIGRRSRRFMETAWHPRRVIERLESWYARVL